MEPMDTQHCRDLVQYHTYLTSSVAARFYVEKCDIIIINSSETGWVHSYKNNDAMIMSESINLPLHRPL